MLNETEETNDFFVTFLPLGASFFIEEGLATPMGLLDSFSSRLNTEKIAQNYCFIKFSCYLFVVGINQNKQKSKKVNLLYDVYFVYFRKKQ